MLNDIETAFVQVRTTFPRQSPESTNCRIPAATFRFNV
jgi:hypothetical protein